MSQAEKIYGYLAQTSNSAADKALLLGLESAEEPYQTSILETILDRGDAATTAYLVSRYHLFTSDRQKLLDQRVVGLYLGLCRCADAGSSQTRQNALTIIQRSRFYRLSYLVGHMLRDKDQAISRHAGRVMLELALWVRRKNRMLEPVESESVDLENPNITEDAANRQYLMMALKTAVNNFNLHQRKEAVLAAMYLVPADQDRFWQNCFEPLDPVCQTVRLFLKHDEEGKLAYFCLSALKKEHLRPTAARAIAKYSSKKTIVELANVFESLNDDQIANKLKLVRQPIWLNPQLMPLGQFSRNEQMALIGFIDAMSIEPQEKAGFLTRFAREATESAAGKIMEILNRDVERELLTTEFLCCMLNSPHEAIALATLDNLVKLAPPSLNKIISQLLMSPHQYLRQRAEDYYKKIAFASYWKNFDSMSYDQQVSAGHAVFKIDPEAHDRWRNCTRMDNPAHRLRAIRIARMLGLIDQHEDIFNVLSHDRDCMVRSCAVGAFEQFNGRLSESSEKCLLNSLKDSDNRVRANVIEVLGKCPPQKTSSIIKSFINSDNNRIRANAIKSLLDWKIVSARHAINDMLADKRPAHRRSAIWLLQNAIDISGRDSHQITEKKSGNKPVSV